VSVTVQSQLCVVLMFSSMISHTLLESKKHIFQVGLIRVRPVHSLNVFQLSPDVNCHPILQ